MWLFSFAQETFILVQKFGVSNGNFGSLWFLIFVFFLENKKIFCPKTIQWFLSYLSLTITKIRKKVNF